MHVRADATIDLTKEQCSELEKVARSRRTPQAVAQRARIVLLTASGLDTRHHWVYLNPTDHALVLCVDEKSQIPALERTQPVLPMGLGYVEGITHDYVRHGTTTLFAAFDVANGQVISRIRAKHRHQEFLDFLRKIAKQTPPELDLHLIVDNLVRVSIRSNAGAH